MSTVMTAKEREEAIATKQKAVVQWKGEPITITFQDVKNYICPLATNQEAAIFLKTCQSLQLNPFANECYLIKYDERDKAAFVIAIDSYLKAAETSKDYDGCEAGIILKDGGGKLDLREGAFILDDEWDKLVGGWAKVFRKDREHPTYIAVHKAECIKYTRGGEPTKFWSKHNQPWMLRKTALKRALVEAFPSLFIGTLATAEVAGDIEGEYREIPEGTLPPGLMKNGKPDWPKFWVRVQNELNLTEEDAHKLLQVESVKELLEQGNTMEQIWLMLVEKVKESQASEPLAEPIDEEPEGEDSEVLFDDSVVANPIDMAWLKESLDKLMWADVGKWLREHYPEAMGASIRKMVESLTREHQEEFVKEVEKRLEAKG